MSFTRPSFACFALMFGLFGGAAFAEDLKIGYIDLQSLVEKSKKASQLQKTFESSVAAETRRLEGEGEKLKKLQADFERDKMVMSKDQLSTRQKELVLQMKIFQQDRLKTQLKMEQERRNLNVKLVERVRKHVEDLAKSKELSAVYERGESGLVYIDPALDLTDEVVKRLDAEP